MLGLDLSEDRSEKQWLKQHRNSFFLPHKSLVWGILCHWQPGLLTDFDFTVTRVWLLTSCSSTEFHSTFHNPRSRVEKAGEKKQRAQSQLSLKEISGDFHVVVLFISHWPELSHMTTSNVKEGWKMEFYSWLSHAQLKCGQPTRANEYSGH